MIIKRYNGTSWDEKYPKTIASAVYTNDGNTSMFDVNQKLKEPYLPNSVFGGMRYVSSIGANVTAESLVTDIDTYVAANGGTRSGCYFVASTTVTIDFTGGTYGHSSSHYEENQSPSPGFTLEKGDWFIFDRLVAGTPDTVYWGFVNNTYQAATNSVKGIIEIATDAEVDTGTATNLAVTPASLAAHYAKDHHNHDADYLGISANAVSASKLAVPRTIALIGDATGSVSFDGSADANLTVTVSGTGHTHDDAYVTVASGYSNIAGGYTQTVSGILDAINTKFGTVDGSISALEANVEVFSDTGEPTTKKTGDIWFDI